MSLDLNKLEKVRDVGNGAIQARCPACAEAGQDRKGEHLRIQPDGKFGCCVFPQDRLHRKRIFALAGDNQPRVIKVRVQRSKTPTAIKDSVLGRLGRVFVTERKAKQEAEASVGTLGTTSNPHAYGNELSIDSHEKVIGFGESVPSVPTCERMPYLLPSGNVIIPFDCPPKYRWWAGGQSRAETQAELKAQRQKSST